MSTCFVLPRGPVGKCSFDKLYHQASIFDADMQYLDKVGRDSFLVSLQLIVIVFSMTRILPNFIVFDNDREGVPPSIVAISLLLQTYNPLAMRSGSAPTFDVLWCVAQAVTIFLLMISKSLNFISYKWIF
ncbi:MAG: hypothetical protein ACE5JB_11245 [bacterium]